jgi:hypothetical protein
MTTLTQRSALWRRPIIVLSLILALTSLVTQPTAQGQATLAATRKLSAITAADGLVKDARIAGDYIIYLANYDTENRYDLYSAPLAGGAVTRLTAGLPAAEIKTFAVTSAGHVVFSARHGAGNRPYLYSASAADGTLTLLGPTYPTSPRPMTGSQLIFGLAGERVIFGVDAQIPNGFELFSVPISGGPVARLSPELPPVNFFYPAPFWVTKFAIDDGAGLHVAFTVRQGPVPQGGGLYAVPADASVPPALIGAGGDTFDLTPDGQRVVYLSDSELRTIGFDGSGDTLIDTGSPILFTITPDSARVVYSLSGMAGTIKSALLAGGAPVTITADARYAAQYTFQLSPDGTSVFYNDSSYSALLVAPVLGGAGQTVFNTPASINGFTHDGGHAIFLGIDNGASALYSYPMAGGLARRIDDPADSAGGILSFDRVIAGDRVLYAASNAAAEGVFQLYSASVAGGPSIPLSGNLGTDQELIWARGAVASGTVIFTSGTRNNGPTRWRRLYAVPADGSTAKRLVDTPRSPVGDVISFATSPTDGRAVYLADQEQDGVVHLYSVPLAGGVATKLNFAEQRVSSFKISPAGGRVLYQARVGMAGSEVLYSVPISGGSPTQVGTDVAPGQGISDFRFTPDGAHILYQVGIVGTPPTQTLYSVPATGGNAVVVAENVERFAIDPTGARVAFVAGANPAVLKSAPVTGGSSTTLGPVNESGPLLFTADGAQIVYETAGGFFGILTIVSQPLAGGDPITLVEAGGMLENPTIQLSADSDAILYGGQVARENSNQPFSFRIQRIPLAGGAAMMLATPSLPADSYAPLLSFAQAVGGGPLVYHLRSSAPGDMVVQTLASVPATGGMETTLLSSTGLNSAPLAFRLSDDGSQVLFAVGGDLHRVLAAGGIPEKLSVGGAIGAFAFAEDGSALFIEGGALFHAPVGSPPARLDDLPVGAAAESFTMAGQFVVFTAVTDASPSISASGTTELYSTDIMLAPPASGFTASTISITEGTGSADVEVWLARAASAPITVSFSVTGGSAVAGVDYTLGASPLTFAPGATVATLPLTILDRPHFSGSRTIMITLGAQASALASSTQPTTITITILDNELGLFLPLLRR